MMQVLLKRIYFTVSFLLIFVSVQGQILTPVKWSFTTEKTAENEVDLVFTAKIDKGWHLYSQFIAEGGPIPTSFSFTQTKDFKKISKVKEGKPQEFMDPNFEMLLKFFSDKAVFRQKIKQLSSKPFTIKGSLEFMVCDDSRCLPPETVDFEFKLDGASALIEKSSVDTDTSSVDTSSSQPIKIDTSGAAIKSSSEIIKPAENTDLGDDLSIWGIFFSGFVGGLLALFTPCVFPMIPLTVSFFTKQGKSRKEGITKALIFGASIIVIYVALGMLITLSLGPDALNAMASNVIVNLLFFIIFIVFAISFLGAFEITLPSAWVNKADVASDKGGLIGIFFMAFTLSLVSFSCTGPIIGTLLVQAAVGGNIINPIIGMLGFSLALALPFTWFATFPGYLNSLPKSGGWLNSVKVVLGLLELALALKFLSNVDLAYHWEIITREVFIALWIIIFSVLGFYLLGKIRFSHDTELPYITIPRLLFAIGVFSFVVYLIPGMWGAPLRLISGFPPPEFYTEGWKLGAASNSQGQADVNYIVGINKEHCPHNLSCFHDYDLALAHAKKTGKPLMVDFTGWSCVNCRRMEDKVWIDPRVLTRLENDYVLVSLYVDDKVDLPAEQQYVSGITGKKVKTAGNKWSDMQTSRFGTNSQPYYALLDNTEQLLIKPSGYNPNVEEYVKFLDKGKEEFKKRMNQ